MPAGGAGRVQAAEEDGPGGGGGPVQHPAHRGQGTAVENRQGAGLSAQTQEKMSRAVPDGTAVVWGRLPRAAASFT